MMSRLSQSGTEVASPVSLTDRISALDFIRGIAVLGILAANIVGFGQPFNGYFFPKAFLVPVGDPGGWMWIAQFVLIDGKMRGLFTLLFGAGLALFMDRAWAHGETLWLQAWRLVLLMGFGLIHFYFIWEGDILFSYGFVGIIALAALRWSPGQQLIFGLSGYAMGVFYYALEFTYPWLIIATELGRSSSALAAERVNMLAGVEQTLAAPDPAAIAILHGDYASLTAFRLTEETWKPLINAQLFAFETLPLMLIGMALLRLGFFSGAFARAKLLRWGWIGVVLGGIAHVAIGLVVKWDGFSYYGTLAALLGLSPLPRLPMVLGFAALMVAYAPAATGWLGERVRAAGRAAFTNYLGTSVVMMLVFHGWALGLFGQLNRPQLYIVVVLTWVLMLAWSKPWLDRFRYGPLEWLWRCLTYRTVFPLRK